MSENKENAQKTRSLYREEEAIAHVQELPGIHPVRIFKILFPLYEVEVEGIYREGAPYELMTRYIERGIHEAELRTAQQLADFFSLDIHLVDKVLAFLKTMGHIGQYSNGALYLTSQGEQSLRDGVMYTSKETHRKLYFEGLHLSPLKREHYERNIRMIAPLELNEHTKLRDFKPLSSAPWSSNAVDQLEKRRDRPEYNLPDGIHDLKTRETIMVFLPMYIIETYKVENPRKPYYIAYTNIRDKRDVFFENLFNTYQELQVLLTMESLHENGKKQDVLTFWRNWLIKNGFSYAKLEQTSGGVWQAVFPSEHFLRSSKISLASIGIYYIEKNLFLRIWCKDESAREKSAFEQIVRIVRRHKRTTSLEDVQELLQRFTIRLNTGVLPLADLLEYATRKDMKDIVKLVDELMRTS